MTNNSCSDFAKNEGQVMMGALPEGKDSEADKECSDKRVSEIIAKSQFQTESGNEIKEKFDYRKYQRRPQDYVEALGSKKILSNIPVKKPDKTSWVRVQPEIEVPVGIYEDKRNREYYLVEPDLYGDLGSNLIGAILFLAITSSGDLFFWLVKSNGTGQSNRWAESSLEAVKLGKKRWVRVEANMTAGGYDVFVPANDPPDPEWGDVDLNNLLEEAFRSRIIDNLDHPVISNLKGRFSC
jgi:hypothetical protein